VARLTADHLTPAPGKWPKQDLHIGIFGWTYQPWRGVFVYFDNDAKVHAPFNAKTLAAKLQGAAVYKPPT
jgi:uncharacterized protein YecE (DUF72 family)